MAQPIKLDMSTAQPLAGAVKLDMSTAQPLETAAAPAASPGVLSTAWEGAKNFGLGAVKSAGETLSNTANLFSHANPGAFAGMPIAGRPTGASSPFPSPNPPEGIMQNLGATGERIGEMFLAGAPLKAAATSMLSPGFLSRVGVEAANSGLNAAMHGENPVAGAALGAGTGVLGEGMRALAPSLAESSLGIRRLDRARGRTPGIAALEETAGVRPATVANSANARIGDLTGQLNTVTRNAPFSLTGGPTTTVTAQPAIDAVDDAIAKSQAKNSPRQFELQQIRGQLTKNLATDAPLPVTTTPWDLLQRKRGVGDIMGNWNPEVQKGVKPTISSVYGAMDSQLDNAVPGTQELNDRISSLIPVAQRAQGQDLNAGIVQRAAGRIGAHSGALAGAIAGGYAGNKEGGIPGAIGGAATGLLLPELFASPEAKMAAARALFSPAVTSSAERLTNAAALQLFKKR